MGLSVPELCQDWEAGDMDALHGEKGYTPGRRSKGAGLATAGFSEHLACDRLLQMGRSYLLKYEEGGALGPGPGTVVGGEGRRERSAEAVGGGRGRAGAQRGL